MKKIFSTLSRRQTKKLHIPSFVTLAWWQVRPTWRLLSIIAIAIILAVAFVCTVPLYSDVTMTAGLRTALTSPTQNSDITISSNSELLNTDAVNKGTESLDTIFQNDFGSLISTEHFSIQTSGYSLMTKSTAPSGQPQYNPTLDSISFISAPMNSMPQHITLLRGRLPQTSTSAIEVALTAESANQLHVRVGSQLTVQIVFNPIPLPSNMNVHILFLPVPVRVVGIIAPPSLDDSYWHSTTFLSTFKNAPGIIYTGLTSSEGFLNYFSQLFSTSTMSRYTFAQPCTLVWYYPFNVSHISFDDLDTINNDNIQVQGDVNIDIYLLNSPMIESPDIQTPTDLLQRFLARSAVVAIPTGSLLLMVVGLVLFFVNLISNILIERQSETIAILRSRGASRKQIFGVFATQSVALGLIALLLGPIIATILVLCITPFVLPPTNRDAVNILISLATIQHLGWYPLLAALVAVCTTVLAIAQRISSNILSVRREVARATQSTFVQRLNLDIFAFVAAIAIFIILEYVLNSGLVDTKLNLLLLTPLTLFSMFSLTLAATLLFLRLFPLLLQFGTYMTIKRRGAVSMLTLAQMSRTPQQSLRTTLLLTLTTASLLFLCIFIPSQSQRIPDVAAYQTGADFSGSIQTNGFTTIDRPQLTAQYRRVPGILSASVGYLTTLGTTVGDTSQLTMQLNAVDSSTYAQTATWPQQDATHPLPSLMQQFIARRNASITNNVIPAVVDSAMWQALQLKPNAPFTLTVNNSDIIDGNLNFIAIAEVQHIPTVNDGSVTGDTLGIVTTGGLMVDYQTFAQVYLNNFAVVGAALPINYVWLKTKSDASSLLHIRNILNNPTACCLQLQNIYDRRAIIEDLQHDPLYLDVIGLLAIGACITIILLLLGSLIASWLNVRNRLAQFAVLHALGATSRQVSSILLWEQGISYVTGIILGLLFGLLLAVVLIPSLLYTGVVSSGFNSNLTTTQFYLIQNSPPTHIVLPLWLPLLLALLLLIFATTFMLIVPVIIRLSPAQILRLNVD